MKQLFHCSLPAAVIRLHDSTVARYITTSTVLAVASAPGLSQSIQDSEAGIAAPLLIELWSNSPDPPASLPLLTCQVTWLYRGPLRHNQHCPCNNCGSLSSLLCSQHSEQSSRHCCCFDYCIVNNCTDPPAPFLLLIHQVTRLYRGPLHHFQHCPCGHLGPLCCSQHSS